MLKTSNGVFRPKRVNFAQVSNSALQDNLLSLKAKGLYALIQSLITLPRKDDDDDGLKVWDIRSRCQEGDSAFESAWKELKKCGYLKQYRIPNPKKRGRFRYEYELLDKQDLSTPAMISLTIKGEVSTVHLQPDSHDDIHKKANKKKWMNFKPKAKSDHTPKNKGDSTQHTSETCGNDTRHTPENQVNDTHHAPENQVNGIDHTNRDKGIDHTPLFPYDGESTPCSNHPVKRGGDNSNTQSGNTLLDNTQTGNIQSISLSDDDCTDRPTDETRSRILDQIEYDWIKENRPNYLQSANALVDCMVEMETLPFTKISQVNQSKYALKKRLDTVTAEDVTNFIDHMRGVKLKNIRNISAYWKSAFINFLGEQDLGLSTV